MEMVLEELTQDELAMLERYRKERDSDNEYTPWISEGITETQYFHRLYLEASNQLATLIDACEWVIIDGGKCIPLELSTPEQNPQKVTVAWIEASRRDWAKLARERQEFIEQNALQYEYDMWKKARSTHPG